jgi:hypothetical protein
MNKLFIPLIGIFFSMSVIASDQPLTLQQQISHVKEYLKNIKHPRLILGVGNAPELNGNPGPNPFLDNANDILASNEQKPAVLVNRSLTLNFNDLAQLNKLSEAFADTFEVITTDFLVTKYAEWTKDHIAAFKRMLKPGGIFVFPIDQWSQAVINAQADNVEDLFKKAGEKLQLLTNPELRFGVRGYLFENLPKHLNVSADPQMQQNINQQLAKYKDFRLHFDDSTLEAAHKTIKQLEKLQLAPYITKDILNDDKKLSDFVHDEVLRTYQSVIQSQLSDEFIDKYVSPQYWKRIIGMAFDPQKITAQKNMALPQPHRKSTFDAYSISATK